MPRPFISADRGPASSGGASKTQMVQVTRVDGSTYEAHAKFAEGAENGARGLASELLASGLARLLNANVPDGVVVDLLPEQTITLRDGCQPASGLAVALTSIQPSVDVNDPSAILDISVHTLAVLSAAESWTEVGDRGHNMIRSHDEVYAVDFASAFASIWNGAVALPALVDDPLLRDRLLAEPLAMLGAADTLELISNDEIDAAVGEVPDIWMDAAQKAAFCGGLKLTRQSVVAQIRAQYPHP